MKTLLDRQVNDSIVIRIQKLDPSIEPHWGKMNVARMLAHLHLSFQVNLGKIVLKRDLLLSTILRPVAKNILLGEKPFRKNLPTDKKLLPTEPVDFFDEQRKVIEIIKRYVSIGPGIITKNPHNILGKITPEQSAFISYKHVDHHLRQFGI